MNDDRFTEKLFGSLENRKAQLFIISLADRLHEKWQKSRELLKDEKGNQIFNLDNSPRRESRWKPVEDVYFAAKYISKFTYNTLEQEEFFIRRNSQRINIMEKYEIEKDSTIKYNKETKSIECDIANLSNSQLPKNLQKENLKAALTVYLISISTSILAQTLIEDNKLFEVIVKDEGRMYELKKFLYTNPNRKIMNKENNVQLIVESIIKIMDDAHSTIHQEWMDRNPVDDIGKYTIRQLEEMKKNNPEYYSFIMRHVPFVKLPEYEQLKDIDHITELYITLADIREGKIDLSKYEKLRMSLVSEGFFGNVGKNDERDRTI